VSSTLDCKTTVEDGRGPSTASRSKKPGQYLNKRIGRSKKDARRIEKAIDEKEKRTGERVS